MRKPSMMAAAVFIAVLAGISVPAQEPFDWKLPAGLAPPVVPPDNPMSVARATLGRYLFYDTRVSGNGKQSCGSCHEQAKAFTDGRAQSVGSTGELHPRGRMSLVNIGFEAGVA